MKQDEIAALIAELKPKAEAATPGPWDTIQGSTVRAIKGELAVPIFHSEAPLDWHKNKRLTHKVLCAAYAAEVQNATYIAAANPSAILSLIDAIEQLSAGRQDAPASEVQPAQPFAYFQFNEGWKIWEQVIEEAKGEEGVVAAYRAAPRQSAPVSDDAERVCVGLDVVSDKISRDDGWFFVKADAAYVTEAIALIRTQAQEIARLTEELAGANDILDERDDRMALVDRIADLIGLPEDQELDQVAFDMWFSAETARAEKAEADLAQAREERDNAIDWTNKTITDRERALVYQVNCALADVTRLEGEAAQTAQAIGDEFMLDPPDGGDVKLWEGAARLRSSRDAALARVDALRVALEPFAELSDKLHSGYDDGIAAGDSPSIYVLVKHLRAARAELEKDASND